MIGRALRDLLYSLKIDVMSNESTKNKEAIQDYKIGQKCISNLTRVLEIFIKNNAWNILFFLLIIVIFVFETKGVLPNLATWLETLAFLKILDLLSKLGLLIAIITFMKEIPKRSENIKLEKKRTQYEAWRVVNSALDQTGSGGRIQALEDLNKDGVSLRGLTASKAYLAGIDLRKASLQEAKLQGVNLESAQLQEADLQDADLREARLFRTQLQEAKLLGAKLQEANLSESNLSKAMLQGADLSKARLLSCKLQGAQLASANLQNAFLGGAQLQKAWLSLANFQDADLFKANLSGAKLEKAKFQKANLLEADLAEADLTKADFTSAQNLDPLKFLKAKNWESAIFDSDFRSKLNAEQTKRRVE